MSLELEIREELVAIKKRIEQLIKNIDKVTGAPPDLFADQEEQQPIKTFKKSANPFFQGIKKLYMDYFEKNKGMKYAWAAKDSTAANRIVDKIILVSGLKKREVFEAPDNYQIVFDTFKQILDNLEKADKFTFDNLSINLIDSRFSTIASKIKNGNGGNNMTSYENELRQKIQE